LNDATVTKAGRYEIVGELAAAHGRGLQGHGPGDRTHVAVKHPLSEEGTGLSRPTSDTFRRSAAQLAEHPNIVWCSTRREVAFTTSYGVVRKSLRRVDDVEHHDVSDASASLPHASVWIVVEVRGGEAVLLRSPDGFDRTVRPITVHGL